MQAFRKLIDVDISNTDLEFGLVIAVVLAVDTILLTVDVFMTGKTRNVVCLYKGCNTCWARCFGRLLFSGLFFLVYVTILIAIVAFALFFFLFVFKFLVDLLCAGSASLSDEFVFHLSQIGLGEDITWADLSQECDGFAASTTYFTQCLVGCSLVLMGQINFACIVASNYTLISAGIYDQNEKRGYLQAGVPAAAYDRMVNPM